MPELDRPSPIRLILPLPIHTEDPVGRLIIQSIRMVLYSVVLVGVVAAWSLVVGLQARDASNNVKVNGQRSACITDLRSIEAQATGRQLDSILIGLALTTDYSVADLREYLAGDTPADEQAVYDAAVRQGLEAIRERQEAQENLGQPALDEICGEPAN